MVINTHFHLLDWFMCMVMIAFFFPKLPNATPLNFDSYQNRNSAVSTADAPAMEILTDNFLKKLGVVGFSVGAIEIFIILLGLWFWKKNGEDEEQAALKTPLNTAKIDDNEVHLDKSMEDDGIELNESTEDDGVDVDKSMDDDGVDFDKSMDVDFIKVTGARTFSYEDLISATNNFSEQEKLGEGGFGAVYKGFLKELNCFVAVKRISRDSKQGIKEFASEVKIISQLRHRNIVQLTGWCHQRKELLLVYEFMPKGSLDSHLFKQSQLLAWEVRYEIAQGLAWGLLYLHEQWEQYVVHRDIKASNIMLDSNFNAKLGDFGLARIADHGKGLENTTMAGTIGYVSPDYATTGRASKESDVYSFGIVALEIACGRKVIDRKAIREDQMYLRDWVWDLFGRGKLLEAADPRLNGGFDKKQMECLMIVGLWCAHPDSKLRPTMEKAIHVLNFVAPLPDLPSEIPMVSYFASFSTASGGTDLVKSEKQPPNFGLNNLVHTGNNISEQDKFAEGGFGSLYKGILRELKSSSFGFWKRSKAKKEDIHFEVAFGPRLFSYRDLAFATNKFSEQMKIGVGGYGSVYKGFLQELNSYVAVKRLSRDSAMKEYTNEVPIISQLRHRNLLQLIGFCHRKRSLFLVYEFMPNAGLDFHLFGEGNLLTWEVRYKIAQDLASGMLYLHEECNQCVVHKNIKPSNVLLDSNFNAKVGDFCLAKLFEDDKTQLSTDIIGTPGYMAPECFHTGKSTKESDVYSFGIVALEISCGRKNFNFEVNGYEFRNIVDGVWDMYGKGKLLEAADPRLNGDFGKQQMECLMTVGLWCVHPNPNCRPSIRQAIRVLNFEAPTPTLPTIRPAFCWPSLPSHSWSFNSDDFSGDITDTDSTTFVGP